MGLEFQGTDEKCPAALAAAAEAALAAADFWTAAAAAARASDLWMAAATWAAASDLWIAAWAAASLAAATRSWIWLKIKGRILYCLFIDWILF